MVKRYKPNVTIGHSCEAVACMDENARGNYVEFSDYDALAARLAEAERLLRWAADEADRCNILGLANEIRHRLRATDSAEPRDEDA